MWRISLASLCLSCRRLTTNTAVPSFHSRSVIYPVRHHSRFWSECDILASPPLPLLDGRAIVLKNLPFDASKSDIWDMAEEEGGPIDTLRVLNRRFFSTGVFVAGTHSGFVFVVFKSKASSDLILHKQLKFQGRLIESWRWVPTNRVLIRRIPPVVNAGDVKAALLSFGTITDIWLGPDSRDPSTSLAYVEFTNVDEAKALVSLGHVKLWNDLSGHIEYPVTKPRSSLTSSTVVLKDVIDPQQLSSEELKHLFKSYGAISDVRIRLNRLAINRRSIFIEFENISDAKAMVALKEIPFGNVLANVNFDFGKTFYMKKATNVLLGLPLISETIDNVKVKKILLEKMSCFGVITSINIVCLPTAKLVSINFKNDSMTANAISSRSVKLFGCGIPVMASFSKLRMKVKESAIVVKDVPLSRNISVNDVEQSFRFFGTIQSVKVGRDYDDPDKIIIFVNFKTRDMAEMALEVSKQLEGIADDVTE